MTIPVGVKESTKYIIAELPGISAPGIAIKIVDRAASIGQTREKDTILKEVDKAVHELKVEGVIEEGTANENTVIVRSTDAAWHIAA